VEANTMKNAIKAIKFNAESLKNDEGRDYNPKVWVENIDRMSKYTDVQFFKVKADNVFSYNRYYVTYTLPDGTKMFKSFGYSSSMTNNGFTRVVISEFTIDRDTMQLIEFPEGEVEISTMGFYDVYGDGSEYRIKNTPEGRKWMAEDSRSRQTIFTNGSVY
jgi:hypothetical protein